MFQMALLVVKANKCVKLFWNPCINVGVMAWTRSFYDHFIIWPSSVTLTFNQPEKYFKCHSLLQEQQLCLIILKSIHNCRSYGPDKSIRMHHACTQARTNAGTYNIKNCNSYVSLNASRLYKKESSLKGKNLLNLEQILYFMRWPQFIWEVTMKLTEELLCLKEYPFTYDSNGHYIYQAADMYHVFWIMPYSNRNNILLHSQI